MCSLLGVLGWMDKGSLSKSKQVACSMSEAPQKINGNYYLLVREIPLVNDSSFFVMFMNLRVNLVMG